MALMWIFAAGLRWLIFTSREPWGDQQSVYMGASWFMEGDYHLLEPGEYCNLYPHQLGLIVVFEFLYLFVGAGNYHAYEAVCLILAVGSVYCGYRILLKMTDRLAVIVGYNIFICGCLPLIFYTSWVYGEIPSIFFSLLSGWMMLSYAKEKKNRYLVILVIALVMAILVRRNSLILLAAVGMVVFLYGLRYKDRKPFAAFLAALVCSSASFGLIYKMYEVRSGYEHSGGIPIVTWLAMGLQESNTERYIWYGGYPVYGWYNGYTYDTYKDTGYDTEKTAALSKESIQERLKIFREDPAYTIMFFKEKILSQWIEPLYESIHFNWVKSEKDPLVAGVGDEHYAEVLAMSDRWQFIVYAGMLCYFFCAVKKDSDLLRHVLPITIIGAFIYHALFEAKGRYAFPYYVMMYPYALYGYEAAIVQAGKAADRLRRFRRNRETAAPSFQNKAS